MPDDPNIPTPPQNGPVSREDAGIAEYLRPRLTGERFDGHAIPLEFLKDLAVIEEMVIEVAKWRFLQANADRKRSPRGFTSGVSLRLTGVEDGSAVPVISLVMAGGTLFPPENQSYFMEARDAIVSAVRAAETEQPAGILQYLPERALSYFDRIGRSLRDGEAMELAANQDAAPARLTKETRRRLVLASSRAHALTEETVVRGVIPEADQDALTFQIQLPDGRKVPSPMTEPHVDTILEAFNGFRTGVRVLLEGIGRRTRTGKLERIESIEHMSLLDPLDVMARLDELRSLKNGWLEGIGTAPDPDGLDWLAAAFETQYSDDLPLPYLYPTEDGGVRAEWPFDNTEASLDIDLLSKRAIWHDLNLETDAEETQELDLSDAAGWTWIADRIGALPGGGR
ncbi:MAG: hypothetical protein ACF8Q5_13700 [Phycisphaerales bacterium JB040]